MITLAFAQMVYYVFVSLKVYGGDDGLPLAGRSLLGLGLNLKSDVTFYYVVLAIFAVAFYFLARLVNSRFGRVLQGIRENETRMEAAGYPVYRYKLIAFVLAGALAGLGGALLANQNELASPNLLHWTQSGMLLIMVILGGVGFLYGGVLGRRGAAAAGGGAVRATPSTGSSASGWCCWRWCCTRPTGCPPCCGESAPNG